MEQNEVDRTRDDLWEEMVEAGEVQLGESDWVWKYAASREAAEQEMKRLMEPPSPLPTYAVVAYGPRDDLDWLYHSPSGDGEGKGANEMRAFMKSARS